MKTSVLFLCTGNSARSQMAEGLLRLFAGDRYEVFSAGTQPVGLNPLAVEAMHEVGADISAQRSKHVSEFDGMAISSVVTVCDRARESCPIFPGAGRMLHWSFDDPAAAGGSHSEKLAEFRRVRDLIAERIRNEFVPAGEPQL
jgi:arsenate reductase